MARRAERLLQPGRIRCIVPGCGHTTKAVAKNGDKLTEWICAKHWRHVIPTVRKMHTRRQGNLRRARDAALDGSEMTRQEFVMFQECADVIWSAAKQQAIEAAMGIG